MLSPPITIDQPLVQIGTLDEWPVCCSASSVLTNTVLHLICNRSGLLMVLDSVLEPLHILIRHKMYDESRCTAAVWGGRKGPFYSSFTIVTIFQEQAYRNYI